MQHHRSPIEDSRHKCAEVKAGVSTFGNNEADRRLDAHLSVQVVLHAS
jgi:hypothetical protein